MLEAELITPFTRITLFVTVINVTSANGSTSGASSVASAFIAVRLAASAIVFKEASAVSAEAADVANVIFTDVSARRVTTAVVMSPAMHCISPVTPQTFFVSSAIYSASKTFPSGSSLSAARPVNLASIPASTSVQNVAPVKTVLSVAHARPAIAGVPLAPVLHTILVTSVTLQKLVSAGVMGSVSQLGSSATAGTAAAFLVP